MATIPTADTSTVTSSYLRKIHRGGQARPLRPYGPVVFKKRVTVTNIKQLDVYEILTLPSDYDIFVWRVDGADTNVGHNLSTAIGLTWSSGYGLITPDASLAEYGYWNIGGFDGAEASAGGFYASGDTLQFEWSALDNALADLQFAVYAWVGDQVDLGTETVAGTGTP